MVLENETLPVNRPVFSTNTYSHGITDREGVTRQRDCSNQKWYLNWDAVLAGQLHSPDVINYFGGSNKVTGRDAVENAQENGSKI